LKIEVCHVDLEERGGWHLRLRNSQNARVEIELVDTKTKRLTEVSAVFSGSAPDVENRLSGRAILSNQLRDGCCLGSEVLEGAVEGGYKAQRNR
jgi:hypothetical protein